MGQAKISDGYLVGFSDMFGTVSLNVFVGPTAVADISASDFLFA